MYKHCKTLEDKDMNFLDFFSDHLINFDCLTDHHRDGDEQKPHQSADYRQECISTHYFIQVEQAGQIGNPAFIIIQPLAVRTEISSGEISQVFRPPIS